MIKISKIKKTGRVLITGVCGAIGSHLADALIRRGREVIGVDDLSFGKEENIRHLLRHRQFKFIIQDICDDKSLVRKAGPVKYIFHMAAVKKVAEKDSAWPTLHVNAMGTESVLRLARRMGAKIILGSTSDVYGLQAKIPFREDDRLVLGAPTAKRWAYAASKIYCEHAAMSFFKDFGVPVVILRYFGAFSERSSTAWSGGHIPVFIDRIIKGLPVVIHGNGRQTRSMAHMSDIVDGTLRAMDCPKAVGEIINIGNDEEMSVLDTAKLIHRLCGAKDPLRIEFKPLKSVFGSYEEIPRRVPDLSKAKRLLNYRPRISFQEALMRVIELRRKCL